MSDSKIKSIYSYVIHLSCVPFLVSSYHATANTTTTSHKPLKFYMQPRHQKLQRLATPDDLRADGIPNLNSILLLVNISFGFPPVPQLLIMDTASELTWIQCSSCTECHSETTPVYNPSESKTYNNITCDSCDEPHECDTATNSCLYTIEYADNSTTRGKIGLDQMTFKKSGGGTFTEGQVIFGCGTENYFDPQLDIGSGILGLDAGPLSFTTQKGHKFSYCIGDLNNHSYAYNHLIIGNGAIFRGYGTPLEVYDDKYYLTLESISVGDKLLNIDPKVFLRTPSGDGGMIIDSGSSFTYLPPAAYQAVKDEVSSLIGIIWQRKTIKDYLCYSGLMNQTVGFPTVTLHFEAGADLGLQSGSLFLQWDDFTICMAMKPTENGGNGIIGLVAQQKYNVAYDPDSKELYLDYIDCAILEG